MDMLFDVTVIIVMNHHVCSMHACTYNYSPSTKLKVQKGKSAVSWLSNN